MDLEALVSAVCAHLNATGDKALIADAYDRQSEGLEQDALAMQAERLKA